MTMKLEEISKQLIDFLLFFQDPLGHLCDLIDFATEMTAKLEEINKHMIDFIIFFQDPLGHL